MHLNLLVIKTNNPEKLASQYENLGLTFTHHQHGKGPWHYSTQIGSTVFEIYPLPKSVSVADSTTRLGFSVDDLDKFIYSLADTNWKIISPPNRTSWGYSAIIQDIDGRKIELTCE